MKPSVEFECKHLQNKTTVERTHPPSNMTGVTLQGISCFTSCVHRLYFTYFTLIFCIVQHLKVSALGPTSLKSKMFCRSVKR